jgi:5'-nucleotidase / UDP-sugar diphosphatase
MINKNLPTRLSCLMVICLAFCLMPLSVFAAQADNVTINILSINDLHGALVATQSSPGAAKMSAIIKQEKTNDPATLLFAAGDMSQGSFESDELRGAPVIEALNEIGVNAATFGNHEFDWGVDVLKQQMESSQFPWLAANIIDKETGKRSNLWRPYAIFDIKGVKVGVIGLATPETATATNPNNIKNFSFANPSKAVQELLPELRQQGVDIILALTHLGSFMDVSTGQLSGDGLTVAKSCPELQAVISAHTHQKVYGMVGNAALIQAASHGQLVGKITIEYNPKTRTVEKITPSIIDVTAASQPPDPAVEKIIDKTLKNIGPIRNQVIGQLAEPLPRSWAEVSPLGQWVTDNMRKAVNADIAFTNPGELRTDLPAGDITKGMLHEMMPFDNTLYIVELTGTQVYEVLQSGLRNPKGLLQYSGLKVTYDPNQSGTAAFVAVTLSDGSNLVPDKTYLVVTNDFIAAGGDGYSVFQQVLNGKDTHIQIRDILENAIQGKTIHFVPDTRFIQVVTHDKAA